MGVTSGTLLRERKGLPWKKKIIETITSVHSCNKKGKQDTSPMEQ